jgi:pantoate kinase
VPKDIKHSLEQINEVSRQLLSRILSVQNITQEHTNVINESNNDSTTDSLIKDNELTQLMTQRERLISCLLKDTTTEQLAQELDLLNEMVSLDSELTNSSQSCKETLAAQVIKLKKSKKVTKSYQKY